MGEVVKTLEFKVFYKVCLLYLILVWLSFLKCRFVLFFVMMKREKKDNGVMFIFICCNIIIIRIILFFKKKDKRYVCFIFLKFSYFYYCRYEEFDLEVN